MPPRRTASAITKMYIRPCKVCGKTMEGEYDKLVKYHYGCVPKCKVENCVSKVFSAGYCQKHNWRWRRGASLEFNNCKGCGVKIGTRSKWCENCKDLRLHSARNLIVGDAAYCPEVGDNADCPRRKKCHKKSCASPKVLEGRKIKIRNDAGIKHHSVQSDLHYEKPISKSHAIGIRL